MKEVSHDTQKHDEKKQQALEAILGKMHGFVGHAIIPFQVGGAVDMYYFPETEYGMGFVLGDYFDDQVLILKVCWGGKSLAVDFRPPSSGGTVGPYYTLMINDIQSSINNIPTEFPGYNGETIEIAGFIWFQGWNDGEKESYINEYEENLKNLFDDSVFKYVYL